MERVSTYPKDFAKPLLLSLSQLKNCNVICLDLNFSSWDRHWRFLYMLPVYTMHYLSLSMYIVKLFTEGLDPFEEPDMIPMFLISTQVLNKSGKIVAWLYLLLPLVEKLVRAVFVGREANWRLPYACVYPFAVDNWATYLGVYTFQVYNVYLTVFSYMGTNLLLVTLCTYISILFLLIQEDLINIKPINKSKVAKLDYDNEISEAQESGCSVEDIVRRHQVVILLTEQLNAMFNKIVFVNLLFSTSIICFFAVAAKASTGTAHMLINNAAIIIVMVTVFILCYCSELLVASSTGIAQAAAKNMWYKGDMRHQTIIYLIILRAQKPCTLRSLNYSSISMKTFNKVLKTTYSYFSLASQMYDARD